MSILVKFGLVFLNTYNENSNLMYLFRYYISVKLLLIPKGFIGSIKSTLVFKNYLVIKNLRLDFNSLLRLKSMKVQ